jgi:hypothetical protein
LCALRINPNQEEGESAVDTEVGSRVDIKTGVIGREAEA